MADILNAVTDQINSNGSVLESVLRWDLNANEILSLADAIMAETRTIYDNIAASQSNPSFETVCQPMINNDVLFHVVESICTFPQFVSDNKEIRDASTKAEEKLSDFSVEMSSRYDVYLSFQALADSNPTLEGESKRYLDRVLRNFRRKGLHLDENVREEIKTLNKRMSQLCIQFEKNINDENTKLKFSKDELKGLPDDFLESLDKDEDGKFILTLQYPHMVPVSKLCQVSSTRQSMTTAFDSRCVQENTPILEELVELRHKIAQLMGYPTHAAFVTEIRMSKSPENVMEFLESLAAKLTPLQEKEMQVLLDLKRKEEGDCEKLHLWDITYYRNKVEKELYNVDHEVLRQYFPLDKVMEGLLSIYQELFSLEMEEIDGAKWHADARLFKVSDATSKNLIGYFYIDLHPREGKYTHAACWGLQPACKLPKGGRLAPVAALVCNFPKPTADKPALMTHSDVETFFHEFGHGVHQLLSTADLEMFAGTSVERDFVETPSQMLENWCWEPEAVKRMSGHVDTGAPIPDDLMKALCASRVANAGILNKRQILFALFDQKIHTSEKADTMAEYAKLMESIYMVPHIKGTSMPASFGHLAGGYDAQYYGYLWSEVYAMDLYESKFKKNGIFNSDVGRDYAQKILSRGGSVDATDMIRDFLGREPSQEAFLRSKGLNP